MDCKNNKNNLVNNNDLCAEKLHYSEQAINYLMISAGINLQKKDIETIALGSEQHQAILDILWSIDVSGVEPATVFTLENWNEESKVQ